MEIDKRGRKQDIKAERLLRILRCRIRYIGVDQVKIKVLGAHNAESKYTKLTSLLIDDVLVVDAGSLTSDLSFPNQEKIKAILLSHCHYDHIRDVPAFAFSNACRTTNVLGTKHTLKILSSHLIDGEIYPDFSKTTPICEKQTLKFTELEFLKQVDIEDYKITAFPVKHVTDAAGFEIISKDGKSLFYTGDTGPGLSYIWEKISPQLLIMESTFPNKMEDVAKNSNHLVPKTLEKELKDFYQIKGYYPKVLLIHLTPMFEKDIKEEVKEVEKNLKLSIGVVSEGEEIIF